MWASPPPLPTELVIVVFNIDVSADAAAPAAEALWMGRRHLLHGASSYLVGDGGPVLLTTQRRDLEIPLLLILLLDPLVTPPPQL